MSQKRTVVASVFFVGALMFGVFQNCAGGNSISQSDQKSTASSTAATTTPSISTTTSSSASCPGTQLASCTLATTAHAGLSGSCVAGTSGSCSYQCNNGFWGQLYNNCAPAPCAATTINGCSLPASGSGASTGSCVSGDKGGCAATCVNGNWSVSANSCTPKVLTCSFTQPNKYYFANDGTLPATSQSSTADGCASFCQSQGAAMCEYVWVNYVYTCRAYNASQLASAGDPVDFAGVEASGLCSFQ